MAERVWTEHVTQYGHGPSSTFTYGDEHAVLVVEQVGGSLWSVTLEARREKGERAIDFRGTEAEARGFALAVLGWYEGAPDPLLRNASPLAQDARGGVPETSTQGTVGEDGEPCTSHRSHEEGMP